LRGRVVRRPGGQLSDQTDPADRALPGGRRHGFVRAHAVAEDGREARYDADRRQQAGRGRCDRLRRRAKSAPDGYTLLLATTSTHSIGPAIYSKLPYDTVRDFTPIVHVGDAPSIMLVPNNSPAKTVQEWIDYAKKSPGKLNYASSGNGTVVQLTAELFQSQAGISVLHVRTRDGACHS